MISKSLTSDNCRRDIENPIVSLRDSIGVPITTNWFGRCPLSVRTPIVSFNDMKRRATHFEDLIQSVMVRYTYEVPVSNIRSFLPAEVD